MRTLATQLSVFATVALAGQMAFAQATQVLSPPGTGDITKTASYGIGFQIGSNVASGGFTAEDISEQDLLRGILDALNGKDPAISAEVVTSAMQALGQRIATRKAEAGKKYLEENKKKEGVQVTESGLQYKVLKAGNGAAPKASSQVTVHYEGKLINGKIFDSSLKRGMPATFGVSQVIPGWTEALLRMKVGDKWELVIPTELAYGERGSPPVIGPFEVLIFQVELLEVK